MTLFERNAKYFSDSLHIDITGLNFPDTITVHKTKFENAPVLSVANGEVSRSLGSRYSSQKEAETWVRNIEPVNDVQIVIGIGNAKHISLLSNTYRNSIICVIEPKMEFLSVTSLYFDYTELLSIPGIYILKHPSELVHYAPAGLFTSIGYAVSPGYKNVFTDAVNSSIEEIRDCIERIKSDWITQKQLSPSWYKNSVYNLKEQFGLKEKLYSQSDTKNILVTGAGPGLEDICTVDSSKYFIIATDTSVPYLLKKNITPQMIISIDARNISYLSFFKTESRALYLMDITCPPIVTKRIKNKIFITSYFPFISSLVKQGLELPVYDSSPGNVGTIALLFAARFGAEQILSFGIDFCYPHGDMYVRDSYIPLHFIHRQNRLKSYLSQNWEFLSKYALSYNKKQKIYSTHLLTQYAAFNNDVLNKLGYKRTGSSTTYLKQHNSPPAENVLKNSSYHFEKAQDYLMEVSEAALNITRPYEYFGLDSYNRRLIQSILPLMASFSDEPFAKRISLSIQHLSRLFAQ